MYSCANPVAVSSNVTDRYEERTACSLPAYLPASNYTVRGQADDTHFKLGSSTHVIFIKRHLEGP